MIKVKTCLNNFFSYYPFWPVTYYCLPHSFKPRYLERNFHTLIKNVWSRCQLQLSYVHIGYIHDFYSWESTCDTRVKKRYTNKLSPCLNKNDLEDRTTKVHILFRWLNYKNFTVKRVLLEATMFLRCMWVMTKHVKRTRVGLSGYP